MEVEKAVGRMRNWKVSQWNWWVKLIVQLVRRGEENDGNLQYDSGRGEDTKGLGAEYSFTYIPDEM